MKALFCESLPYRSVFRVGSHHYADALTAGGWDALWLSQPISPLHYLMRDKRDWDVRVEAWRHGPLADGALLSYCPFTLLPTADKPLLRSRFVADRSVLACVPPLPRVLARTGFDDVDLVWMTHPVYEPLLPRVRRRALAVRVADDTGEFANVPATVRAAEERAIAEADVVFAVSHAVAERLSQSRDRVVRLPNGVDFDRFAAPRDEPADLADVPGARVVYVGAIEYWFDSDLLRRAAAALPSATFLLIGPTSARTDALAGVPNVRVLGPRSHEDLPAYLQHCDAGIVPFRRDRMVDGIHPIKVYEYLATGLPVVATRWTELERMAAPVALAGPGEFADALAAALGAGRASGEAERVAYARANSWSSRFSVVMESLAAIGLGDTR